MKDAKLGINGEPYQTYGDGREEMLVGECVLIVKPGGGGVAGLEADENGAGGVGNVCKMAVSR